MASSYAWTSPSKYLRIGIPESSLGFPNARAWKAAKITMTSIRFVKHVGEYTVE
jgi:hypothetical protein